MYEYTYICIYNSESLRAVGLLLMELLGALFERVRGMFERVHGTTGPSASVPKYGIGGEESQSLNRPASGPQNLWNKFVDRVRAHICSESPNRPGARPQNWWKEFVGRVRGYITRWRAPTALLPVLTLDSHSVEMRPENQRNFGRFYRQADSRDSRFDTFQDNRFHRFRRQAAGRFSESVQLQLQLLSTHPVQLQLQLLSTHPCPQNLCKRVGVSMGCHGAGVSPVFENRTCAVTVFRETS